MISSSGFFCFHSFSWIFLFQGFWIENMFTDVLCFQFIVQPGIRHWITPDMVKEASDWFDKFFNVLKIAGSKQIAFFTDYSRNPPTKDHVNSAQQPEILKYRLNSAHSLHEKHHTILFIWCSVCLWYRFSQTHNYE